MMTLPEFLLARIAEDEVAAHGADAVPAPWGMWDDARVLAECDAKRQIVTRLDELLADEANLDDHGTNGEIIGLRYAVEALAAAHAHHPDFREEWKP